jgi:endonuclease YncB( thermonuclease family)
VDGPDHLGEPVTAFARALLALALLISPAAAEDVVAPATRDVTGAGMTPGPVVDGPLIREAVPPRPPDPPRWRRYFLPATTDAATFVVNTLVIHIAGVTPPAADATCMLADGTPWPCGRVALYSFRRFLHGRAAECLLPYIDGAADVTAPCRIAKTDLALWLLQQGWARPSDLATAEYWTASAQARCAGIGLWRDTPKPDFCPQS